MVGGERSGSRCHLDRLHHGLDDDYNDVHVRIAEARERAKAGLEIGHDDRVTRIDGPEQLLGREAASGSAGLRVVDLTHDRQTNTVRPIGAEAVEEGLPTRRVFGATVIVEPLAH